MTFQAYLDTIEKKTGLAAEQFIALARDKGFLDISAKAGDIVAWLKADYGLGHGHAMALVNLFKHASGNATGRNEKIERLFSGKKEKWRSAFDRFYAHISTLGDDVGLSPTASYVSILRAGNKVAIVATTADRMDIGFKLKGEPFSDRFSDARTFNAMVTHKVSLTSPAELDQDVLDFATRAYTASAQ
ncbi:MAG: DUF4287 domain-containing protein [Hyphomicrobiaceae bacterium]|nr:DUF4287 domain-containing protein [Hyphomicrobiaceae bacterium]MCC0023658.1 DUF4287 domain-containing protein [Hyphomicrobiaceae bacterium]